MAVVREEGDRGTCEEVPVKAGIFDIHIRQSSIGLDIVGKFADEYDASLNQGEDRNNADMSEAAHIFDQREWEQDEQGGGYALHSSVLPGVKESIVVVGNNSALLQES